MKHTQLEQKKNTYTHLVNKKEHTQLVKEKDHTWWDCQGNIETHSVLKINEEHTKHTNMQKKE